MDLFYCNIGRFINRIEKLMKTQALEKQILKTKKKIKAITAVVFSLLFLLYSTFIRARQSLRFYRSLVITFLAEYHVFFLEDINGVLIKNAISRL